MQNREQFEANWARLRTPVASKTSVILYSIQNKNPKKKKKTKFKNKTNELKQRQLSMLVFAFHIFSFFLFFFYFFLFVLRIFIYLPFFPPFSWFIESAKQFWIRGTKYIFLSFLFSLLLFILLRMRKRFLRCDKKYTIYLSHLSIQKTFISTSLANSNGKHTCEMCCENVSTTTIEWKKTEIFFFRWKYLSFELE